MLSSSRGQLAALEAEIGACFARYAHIRKLANYFQNLEAIFAVADGLPSQPRPGAALQSTPNPARPWPTLVEHFKKSIASFLGPA